MTTKFGNRMVGFTINVTGPAKIDHVSTKKLPDFSMFAVLFIT